MAATKKLVLCSLILFLMPLSANAFVNIETDDFKKIFELSLAQNQLGPARQMRLLDSFLKSLGFSVETTSLRSDSNRPFICQDSRDNDTMPLEGSDSPVKGCVGRLFIYQKIYFNEHENHRVIVTNLGMVEVQIGEEDFENLQTGKIRRIDEDVTRICDNPYDCSLNRETILRPLSP